MDVKHINLYVDDHPAEGVFRVHFAVCSDPDPFELEMTIMLQRIWSFPAFEAHIPKPNDFITATIGRTPVMVTRAREWAGLMDAGLAGRKAHEWARS